MENLKSYLFAQIEILAECSHCGNIDGIDADRTDEESFAKANTYLSKEGWQLATIQSEEGNAVELSSELLCGACARILKELNRIVEM